MDGHGAQPGKRLPGEEAFKLGVVDRLVAQDKVREEATKMAAELCKSGPLAVQAARETLNKHDFAEFRAATEREAMMQMMLRETNDFKEGVKAGFDRRDPVFTGT